MNAGEQIKKTADTIRVVVRRYYDLPAGYSYYLGASNGGREAITAIRDYPDDYEGAVSIMPGLGFTRLVLKMQLIQRAMRLDDGAGRIDGAGAEFLRRRGAAPRQPTSSPWTPMSHHHGPQRQQRDRGVMHRRRLARMDTAKAVKATAHQLARLIYATLTRGEEYVARDLTTWEEERRDRTIKHLQRQARRFNLALVPVRMIGDGRISY